MKVRCHVQDVWANLSLRERRIVKAFYNVSPDAVVRGRCKLVLIVVRGSSLTQIARSGQPSMSQVYRVAQRFVE